MTANAVSAYETLSRLLTYPDAAYGGFVEELPKMLAEEDPKASAELAAFASRVKGLSLTELQELFTRTFDLSPTCSLEVGWHLFGEEYARGAFMVSIRERLRRYGVEENGELPDHLTHILLLADLMETDDRGELIGSYVLPAVQKMAKSLEGKDNPYAMVITTVKGVLERTPGIKRAEAKEDTPHG